MNTVINRDIADLILYADPPLTGQQRPGGGGGGGGGVLTYMSYMGRSRGLSPPPPFFKANLQHYWVWFPDSLSNRTIGWDF